MLYYGAYQDLTTADRRQRQMCIGASAEAVKEVTGERSVAVVIEARHMCMMMRGVQKQNSSMSTSVMMGSFREQQATRSEFLRLIGK